METTNELLKEIDELENERIALSKKSRTWLPVYFLIPILAVLGTVSFTFLPPVIIISAIASISISYALYHANFLSPYSKIKAKVKSILLNEFMSIYHPEITYQYSPSANSGNSIVTKSGLINFDKIKEEDVIIGEKGNVNFYISEIDLIDETTDSEGDTSESSILKGILFNIKMKDKNLTPARIQSSVGLLDRLFSSSIKNEKFGFWIDSNNSTKLEEEIGSLFPFIKHLGREGNDLRISTNGDEITILMETKMKFLDTPKFELNKSFHDEQYYVNMNKQLNSLLFIIDSFVNELSPEEIEQELKLKVIEYAKNNEMN